MVILWSFIGCLVGRLVGILFQAIQFSQIVQIQPIQFSIGIYFVYTQLNVSTVLFKQFSLA